MKSLIDEITECPKKLLPAVLAKHLYWERPRGDLFHWVPVLNRFDEIFESVIKQYELDQEFPKLQEMTAEEVDLLVHCLKFTYTLLDHCANRSIYSSSERVFQLLLSPSIDIRLAALEVAVCIGERYVQSNSNKYSAPKAVKQKMLQVAKFFPPPVPANFIKSSPPPNQQPEKSNAGEHFSLLDTITTKKKYPSKWKLLHFQYFKSVVVAPAPERKKLKSSSKTPTSKEGLADFTLSEEAVRKLSLQQIYDKAVEVIPKELWFSFALSAQVVKSFNTKSYDSIKLREKLLQTKCLALAFICCMYPSSYTSPKFFETEPYIFSFLVDFFQPDNSNRIPPEVFFSVVKAIECISMKQVYSNDIIRCMGGNVNHGTLFQTIRHINKQIRDEQDNIYEKSYIHFFNMLGNLIESKPATPRLTAGGLLNELMTFLDTKSKYRWICSAAVHLMTIYLNKAPDSFGDFVANDGFKLLIDTVNYEVDFALENPNYGGGPPKEALVYYTISFRQANYIRNLMKLVSNLIQSESGDRLRNLFDSSILQSFNKIISNPKIFGPLILSSTIDAVFFIIHNEPTAFSILNEANVISTILDNYENLFIPSSDLLLSLPEVLGAICLNNEGLKKVVELKAIPKYFKSFYNLENAKELVRSDMTTNLGCSFDELGRHYPSLKPIIMEELIALVNNMADFADSKLESISFYSSPDGALYKSRDDPVDTEPKDGEKEIVTWESIGGAYILDNIFFFLGGLLQDSGQWGGDVIRSIKFESWLSFLTLANAPFDYSTSNGLSSLMGVLKYFDDEDREYGLPVLIRIIKEHLKNPRIQAYIHHNDTTTSFFSQFEANPDEGTLFLRELNKLNTLLCTLTEIYVNPSLMFHERHHQIADLLGDEDLQVIEDLVALMSRSILEEVLIRSQLPREVIMQTAPVLDFNKLSIPTPVFSEKPAKQGKQDGTSARLKNTLQIRFFCYRIQKELSTFFSAISKICMMKRQDFTTPEWRRKAVTITIKLGTSISQTLDLSLAPAIYTSYMFTVLNIVSHVITQKERARDYVHTSIAVVLIQTNFFSKLSKITIKLWNNLLTSPPEETKKVPALDYVSVDEGSVLINALSEALGIFVKATNHDSYQKFPSGKHFFHYGYDQNVDGCLIPTILVQVRYEAFGMLCAAIGVDASLYDHDKEHCGNITTEIMNQMIAIFKMVWRARSEVSHTAFTPLDVKNVSPPIDQINYLQSQGLSDTQSDHFFKHIHDIHLVENSPWPECAEIGIPEDRWEELKDIIRQLTVSFEPHYPHVDMSLFLNTSRADQAEEFQENWVQIVSLFPSCAEEIAAMFRFITSDLDATLDDVVMCIIDASDKVDGQVQFDIGPKIHLLCLLLKDEGDIRDRSRIFDNFLSFFLDEMKQYPQYVNRDYFGYGLHIVAQMMSYRSIPQLVECPENLSVLKEQPHTFNDEEVEEIFDMVMKFGEITEVKSAIGVAKLLVLFAKESKYLPLITKSDLLKNLIVLTRNLMEKDEKLVDLYKKIVTILIRVCFETNDVLKSLFSAEISSSFNGRDKKMLFPSFLSNNSSLIARNLELFVNVLNDSALFTNYDGGKVSLASLHVALKEDTDQNKQGEQADSMEISEETEKQPETKPTQIPSTGIVHILLTELMEVTKKDWASDPEVKESNEEDKNKPKDSDIVTLMKNKDFAYACFLLKILTELVGSYKQSKLEFLTFTKKPKSDDKAKPRATALNFLIHQLIPTQSFVKPDGIEYERRTAISSLAQIAILGLVSTPILDNNKPADPHVEDPDMTIIRQFYVDVLLKIMKDTLTLPLVADVRYGKLLDLFHLCGALVNSKFREYAGPLMNEKSTKYDSYFIAKILIDKQIPNQLTSILSELDLNYPNIDRVIKGGLKPLNYLSKVKIDNQEIFAEGSKAGKEDFDIVPEDDEDEGDETPDLFRNSTLGMYDVDDDSEADEMDYYDEQGPLVLMSGEEISDGESDDSDLDSEMEEDDEDEGGDSEDEEMDDGHSIEFGEEYDEEDEGDSDSDIEGRYADAEDDIEIIDVGLDSEDESGEDMSDEHHHHHFHDHHHHHHEHHLSVEEVDEDEEDSDSGDEDNEDEDSSEYDEDELDGWIEAFEDEEGSNIDNDAEREEADPSVVAMRMNRNRNNDWLEPNAEDDIEEGSEDESDIVEDPDLIDLPIGSRRRAREFASSIFEALRPAMVGQPNVASIFGGLFGGPSDDYRLLRGSIQIGDRSGHGVTRFEHFLLNSRSKSDINDPLSNMYVKSTRERWDELCDIFFHSVKSERFYSIFPAAFIKMKDESTEYNAKKIEEAAIAKKEREERIRKRQEEERKKREEEEAKRREAVAASEAAGHDGEGSNVHIPVMVRIGDREVDIGGTDIDPDFFEALPEDMREEVFTQHVRERRANATSTGADAREFDPEFLDALPEQIRDEILQQESMERRFSAINDMRFGEDDDEDEEDEDGDIDLEDEDEDSSHHGSRSRHGSSVGGSGSGANNATTANKSKRIFFTPLVEKSGIASLIKLLFIRQSTSQRDHIHYTLQALCHSKQTRAEVMNILIGILHDGLHNQRAIEKVYHQVSMRAVIHNKSSPQHHHSSHFPIGVTPLIIGIQILEAILYLLERNPHLRYYLLTEHDNNFISKNGSGNRRGNKNKLTLSKEDKYPINYLLKLLNNDVIIEEQTFIDILARVFHIATRPLQVLHNSQAEIPPPFSPPYISDHNYRQMIKILTSNDCPNNTFRRVISAMQSLSILPNAQKVFSFELSDQATNLGQTIIHDLNTLTKELANTTTYNSETKLFTKFSAPNSDQAKLLRILTALDYMFESKEKEKEDDDETKRANVSDNAIDDEDEDHSVAQKKSSFRYSRKMSIDEIEELTGLYKRLALGTLWDALSDCLRVLEEKQGMSNVATALLPLIEALMVVCKHSKVKDLQTKDVTKYEVKKIDFTKEPIERLFFSFTDEHKKILNYMVRTNPNLMSGPFGMLVRNSKVLEFDNKKNYFDRQLHANKNNSNKLSINIRRDQVFLDSYRSLFFKSKDEFRNSKLEINFKGESGIDAGGVTREWYQVLSRQMFNPDYALFTPVASDETTFHPNRTSYINPEHLSFFKFIGRIIGKAIYDGCFLDCHFSRALYKRILGKQVSLKDMENLDLEYFKSLMWMLENDITDVITEDFSVETDDYGEHKIIDLVENGRNIPVTEENKYEYVKLVVEYRLTTSVQEQINNFIIGFHEIIPKELVAIFNEQELELLISGLPDINVDDWKNNTNYVNYSPSSIQIQWFWRAVKSFDNEERAKLLQFSTGTSKVPLNGFKELSGANGTCKFSIHRDYGATDRLPSSHTCFNQIDLPAYETYETLRGSLLLAISESHEGFGLA